MSKQNECFNLIFCSRTTQAIGGNVIDNSNLNAVKYFVNWGSFLPKKYKKFHCQFIFKSENYVSATSTNTTLNDNGFVSMDFGRVNVYDGLSNTQKLGIIYPVINTVGNNFQAYYSSTNNDNNDFWIDYPTNQTITINLKNFAGNNMGNMPHYTLIMNLIGVLEEEMDKSN